LFVIRSRDASKTPGMPQSVQKRQSAMSICSICCGWDLQSVLSDVANKNSSRRTIPSTQRFSVTSMVIQIITVRVVMGVQYGRGHGGSAVDRDVSDIRWGRSQAGVTAKTDAFRAAQGYRVGKRLICGRHSFLRKSSTQELPARGKVSYPEACGTWATNSAVRRE